MFSTFDNSAGWSFWEIGRGDVSNWGNIQPFESDILLFVAVWCLFLSKSPRFSLGLVEWNSKHVPMSFLVLARYSLVA